MPHVLRRPATVAILASLVVITIGVQALWFQRDAAADDRADARYEACLNEWGAGVVAAVEARSDAAAELDEARDRKDALLDDLITITAQAQATGAESEEDLPPALLARYERVLTARIDAQEDFRRFKADYQRAKEENPIPAAPRVECRR